LTKMAVGDSFLCILNRGRGKGPAFNLRTRPPCALRAIEATRHLPGAPASQCGRSSPDLSRHRVRDGALPLIDRRLRLIQTPNPRSGPIPSGPPVRGRRRRRRRRRRRPLQRTPQQARPSGRTQPERSAGDCHIRRPGQPGFSTRGRARPPAQRIRAFTLRRRRRCPGRGGLSRSSASRASARGARGSCGAARPSCSRSEGKECRGARGRRTRPTR
jgi:hypothetical protein